MDRARARESSAVDLAVAADIAEVSRGTDGVRGGAMTLRPSGGLPADSEKTPSTEANMTATASTHRLEVPGGTVHYEVRGSGPLLLVVGQPMTSEPFAPVADLLADHCTVVTYDPHGLGRSTVEDPSLMVTPEVEADDLAGIIDALGGGPADVFGSSGGAVAGLALATRHPDKVRTLVAHEPPVTDLLPDAPQVRAAVDEMADAYVSSGSGAAWGKFVSLVIHNGLVPDGGVPMATWPPPGSETGNHDHDETDQNHEADQAPPAPSPKQHADDELFFLRMLKPFTRYQPVVEALRTGSPRVVIGVGEASREELAPRSALALAERLGEPAAVFPGDHGGFMGDPVAFAARLREVLAQAG
jgi:pimeloyl-ACP methyl ester carboxylesterase